MDWLERLLPPREYVRFVSLGVSVLVFFTLYGGTKLFLRWRDKRRAPPPSAR